MGKVLIKCIQTPMQKYFYDRSLDSVVMVNDEEYQILKTVEKTKLVPDGVLRRFVKSGLLRETAIEEIEHPEKLTFVGRTLYGQSDFAGNSAV